jgi:hypothetical protein
MMNPIRAEVVEAVAFRIDGNIMTANVTNGT